MSPSHESEAVHAKHKIIHLEKTKMSQTKMESEATSLLNHHGLLSDIEDGQTLLFQWGDSEVAFTVKQGTLVEVPMSDITNIRSRDPERHVLFAQAEEKDAKEEESKDDKSGSGSWFSNAIDWFRDLFSSGTLSGSSAEPTMDPSRPDLPIPPGTRPPIGPVTDRPTDPRADPPWFVGGTVTVLSWD
jgi:hypothetical protein